MKPETENNGKAPERPCRDPAFEVWAEALDAFGVGAYHASPDGKLRAVNASLLDLLGFTSEDRLRAVFSQTALWRETEDIVSDEGESEKSHTVVRQRFLPRHDATPVLVRERIRVHFDDDGEASCVEGMIERLDEDQPEGEIGAVSFSETILQTIANLVVVLDSNGRIVAFNRACESVTGYRAEEVIGQPVWDLFLVPSEREAVQSVFHDLASGLFPNEHENFWRRRDGSLRYIAWSNTTILDDHNRVRFVIGTGIDITEQRRLRNEELARAERLAAQGRALIAIASEQALDTRDVYDALPRIVDLVREALDVARVSVWELETGERNARCRAMSEEETGQIAVGDIVDTTDYARPFLEQFPVNRTFAIPDIREDARASELAPLLERQGARAVLMSVIQAPDGVVGLLHCGHTRTRRTWHSDEIAFITAVADRLAVSIALGKQREAENARQETQQRYEMVMARALDMFVLTNGNGTIVEMNPSGLATLGYTAEELVGRNLAELIEPAELEARPLVLDRLGAGESVQHERTFVRKDGTTVPVEANATQVGDDLFLGVMRDITKRRTAERELHRYADRLKTLRDAAVGILEAASVKDIAQVATSSLRALVPCDRASVVLFHQEEDEFEVLAADGALGIGPQEEAPYRGPLEWFRFALNLAPNLEDVYYLPDLEEDSGPMTSSEALRNAGIRSLVWAPLLVEGQLLGSLQAAAREPNAFESKHLDIAREVADPVALAIAHAQLREALEGEAERLEKRVADRTAALAVSNRELETFAYSVSHDLKAPLRAMQGFAEILLDDYGDALDEPGRAYAKHITDAAAAMDTLIRDLLAYSRVGRTPKALEPVALGTAVEQVAHHLGPSLGRRGVKLDVETPLPTVLGHRATLFQVIENLLMNAVTYVAEGETPHVRIRAASMDDLVTLSVIDNGIGIRPEDQERIFESFERLHSSAHYPGTGLGLAIVRRGVQRLGGRAGVESKLGAGSRFWVELQSA